MRLGVRRRIAGNTGTLMALFWLTFAALACSQTEGPVIYVTATVATAVPSGEPTLPNPFRPTFTPNSPTATAIQPTPNPTNPPINAPTRYSVQTGDSLSSLALLYGTSVQDILALNPGLTETTTLFPGQELNLPGRPSVTTPNLKLIPDSEMIYSPAVSRFDVAAYIRFQPGFIRVYSENVGNNRFMSGAEIVQFVAQSTSVNPRLLLALLEYRSGWITNPVPEGNQILYPMGLVSERARGLLSQMDWAARQLNEGYYGWRTRGSQALIFDDRSRLAYASDLNAGTVGVQHFLARSSSGDKAAWQRDVSDSGFFQTYMNLFGDPFRYAIEPLVPPDLQQPTLTLPFAQGEVWYFTSGPHGGWDARASGWAAIDFAPPNPPDDYIISGNCYVSPYFTTASAAGLVVRSGDGQVVVDLDMDGDERTGWTLVYLHIADKDRVAAGTMVQPGTNIGHPSCEGFYLNSLATHMHFARRYNGEWIVADCSACAPGVAAPPFVMSGWTVKGYAGQAYQGYLESGGQIHRAEQGRDDPSNRISW